jgi:hypothetical protein
VLRQRASLLDGFGSIVRRPCGLDLGVGQCREVSR